MRLIELRVRSFCRVSAVDIRPAVGVTPIKGENESGKTSTLDALWVAIKGRAAAPPQPIRKGAEKCTIQASLGTDAVELVVTRTFARTDGADYTQSLDVRTPDGAKVTKTPQATLDALAGQLGFDPLAFERAEPKKQFDMLRSLVPGIDFDAIARRRKDAYDARTLANRLAADSRARAAGIQLPAGAKPVAIDVTSKLNQLADASRVNERRRIAERGLENTVRTRDDKLDEAERLRARAATLEREAGDLDKHARVLTQELADVPAVDEAQLRADLAEANRVEHVIATFEARDEYLRQVDEHDRQASALSAKIDELDRKKADAIAAAKLPVPGLGLGDGEVIFDGLPFSQASAAIKMRTSVAVAMALNPGLKVVLVRDGSLLDKRSLAALSEMAAEHGFDVLLETVDTNAPGGFEIIDGMNAEAAPQARKRT